MYLTEFILLAISVVCQGDWYSIDFGNLNSTKFATADNTKCVVDKNGNFKDKKTCENNRPATCAGCAELNDTALIENFAAWAKLPWSKAYQYFGYTDSKQGMFSTLQMAKIWIIGTNGKPPIYGNDPHAGGGLPSCEAAMEVASQEGGGQVGQLKTVPAADGLPRFLLDPAWDMIQLCGNSEHCVTGSVWQTSSAWIGPDCAACKTVGCYNLMNPLCATLVTIEYAKMASGLQGCLDARSNGQCNAKQLTCRHDANCYHGPFCSRSNGWNSPPCLQMYRQAFQNEALPFCRLAIQACARARSDLIIAYEKLGSQFQANVEALKAYNSSLPNIACPTNPGHWAEAPPSPYCTNDC